jgi:hypothetical protein
VLLQTTAFSGDVSGTYNSTSVDKLKGTPLSVVSLADTNFLVYNSTSGSWENHSVTGDITVDHSGVATIGVGKVTSSNILDGTIANIDISNTAAIAYSKLNLSGSIQDTDVSASSHFAFTNVNQTFSGNNTFSQQANVSGTLATAKGTDLGAVNIDDQAVSTSLVRLTGTSQIVTGFSGGRDGQILTLINAGTNAATIADQSVSSLAANRITTGRGVSVSFPVGSSLTLVYDSAASLWRVSGDVAGGSGAGVTTIGPIDSQTASANGAVILSNSLVLQSASATNPGLVNTSNGQHFAGTKTFDSLLSAAGGLSASGGAITLQGNTNSSLTTTTGSLTLQGAGTTSLLTANAAGAASANVTISSGNVTSGAFASGNVSIDVGTSTGTTGTVTVGGSNASAVTIGNTTGSSTTTVTAGSGGISLTANTTLSADKSFTAGGTATFKDNTNSTTAFRVQDSSGNSVLNADSVNRFVGINNANPNATLDVQASSASFMDGFETGLWVSTMPTRRRQSMC